MGHNSNQGETKSEKIGRFAKEVAATRDVFSTSWQISKGAEIRGVMGIDRGNAFIKSIKNFQSPNQRIF